MPDRHAQQTQAYQEPQRPPAFDERSVDVLPEPGLMAVPGLHATGRTLRRHRGDDPLGGSEVSGDIAGALRRRRGRGSALPASLAGPMGEHFGTDLSTVRVHADPEAGQIARSLQASAFTHGNDVYFAPGAYRPGSAAGQRVLAHEMSHVAAQRSGADHAGPGPLTVGRANDPAEAAADRAADRAMAALRRSHRPAAAPRPDDLAVPTAVPAGVSRGS